MNERVTSVRTRLADPEPEVRRVATQEIPALPAPESCELLLVALGDADWRVRKEAAAVASSVEPRTAVVFAVARALGERDDIGLRNAAVEALVAIGPDAVPGAIDALGRLDADGRKLAIEMLAGAPTLSGMRALAKSVSDPDPNVVIAAIEGLGRANRAGDEARDLATAALGKVLASADTPARLAALEAFRSLGEGVPWTALEPLLGDPLLRRPAIAAAGGATTPRAVLALAEACADPSATLSLEAILALGRSIEEAWGNDDLLDVAAKTLRASARARARLRQLASSSEVDAAARGAAVLALGLVRDPDDVAIIADALADDGVTDHAEAALRLFGQEAVEPLLLAGRTGAPSLRGATLSMLPQLGLGSRSERASGASGASGASALPVRCAPMPTRWPPCARRSPIRRPTSWLPRSRASPSSAGPPTSATSRAMSRVPTPRSRAPPMPRSWRSPRVTSTPRAGLRRGSIRVATPR